MARSSAFACTFAVCFVLCAGRVVELTQDEQQIPQPSDTDYGLTQSDFSTDSSQPVIRVTIWRTTGLSSSNAWESLSSVFSDPLGWMSSHLPHQSIAMPSSLDQATDEQFEDMLRRVSCARMRQAMIDYYSYRKGLASQSAEEEQARTQIHLMPLLDSLNLGTTEPEQTQDDDAASTTSLYSFPLRGSKTSSDREEDDIAKADWDFSVYSKIDDSADSFDQQVHQQVEEHANKHVALRSAGVQQLSSMLHTVSGLLAKPVYDIDAQQDPSDFTIPDVPDVTTSEEAGFDGPLSMEEASYVDDARTWGNYESEDYELFKADRVDMDRAMISKAFQSEPEYVKSAEPMDVGSDLYADPYEDPAYSKADADVQAWDMIPAYYGDVDEYGDSDESDLDWGLFVFTLLSASCVVVWAVVVTQYVKLRAMFCQRELDYESDSVLAPLLEKVQAVEVAAYHVDPDQQGIDTKTALLKAEYCPPQAQI